MSGLTILSQVGFLLLWKISLMHYLDDIQTIENFVNHQAKLFPQKKQKLR